MSELEASNIRRRMMEGKLRKAERGALFSSVPTGYVRIDKERIEKDPDERVRSVLELVFRRFDELQSLRQVMLWLLDEGIELPARANGGTTARGELDPCDLPAGSVTSWRTRSTPAPTPLAAVSCARRCATDASMSFRGRSRVRRTGRILIKDTHEGYISWERYERNRKVISDNAQGSGREGCARRGSRRRRPACGACALRPLRTQADGELLRTMEHVPLRLRKRGGEPRRRQVHRIQRPPRGRGRGRGAAARGSIRSPWRRRCGWLRRIARRSRMPCGQAELALERARYEADRAFRQFDGVDPENRQVAAELERRWNGRLVAVSEMEAALARAQEADRAFRMSDAERAACLELGANLERAWCHERVSPVVRKRLLRAALVEALAHVEDRRVRLVLHWQGGDHSEVCVEKSPPGRHRYATDEETSAIITALARQLPDESIRRDAQPQRPVHRQRPALAESRGCQPSARTGRFPPYREGEEKERGELGVREAARILGVCERTVISRIASGKLPAWQVSKGAPWVIKADDLSRERDPAAAVAVRCSVR